MFLGRPAATALGPARLALACEVPHYFATTVREGDHYRLEFEVFETPRRGPRAAEELTRMWLGSLERRVREHPEQYYWFHRRWKISDGVGGWSAEEREGSNAVAGNGLPPPGVGEAEPTRLR